MPSRCTVAQLSDALVPGETVFMPGSAAEPTPLLDLWRDDPERTRGLRLLHTLVPGINTLAADALDPSAVATGLFMQPVWRQAQRDGRVRHLPLSYSGFVRHVGEAPPVDTCLVQVAPPDAAGRCSLGPAVEFTPLVQRRSRRTIAVVNAQLPAIPGAAWLDLAAVDAVVHADFAPKGYVPGAPDAVAVTIAGHIAEIIEDGCTVQVGLGRVPDALFAQLHGRRGLRLHSGMLSDSALALWQSGAADPASTPTSCVWVGSPALYSALRGMDGVTVAGCDVTHNAAHLAAIPRLRAVNSALSVDLFGQANLEIAEGQAVSGLGGAADFARGARSSPGGVSIVALAASYAKGTRSRLVPWLGEAVTSLPRNDVDVVVTEYGSADLRGCSVYQRAERLIGIAAPMFRAGLMEAWATITARL